MGCTNDRPLLPLFRLVCSKVPTFSTRTSSMRELAYHKWSCVAEPLNNNSFFNDVAHDHFRLVFGGQWQLDACHAKRTLSTGAGKGCTRFFGERKQADPHSQQTSALRQQCMMQCVDLFGSQVWQLSAGGCDSVPTSMFCCGQQIIFFA